MKKIILSLMVVLVGFLLSACKTQEEVYGDVSVMVPFGTPLIAVGGLIGVEGINVEAVNDPSLLTAAMITQ